MLGLMQALSGLGAWAAGIVAAKWGYKVALVAAVVAVYVAVWAAMGVALVAMINLIPSFPVSSLFLLQFFPSRLSISVAASAYFGTLALMRSLDYWRLVTGLAARVGS